MSTTPVTHGPAPTVEVHDPADDIHFFHGAHLVTTGGHSLRAELDAVQIEVAALKADITAKRSAPPGKPIAQKKGSTDA